jgi:thiazole tautomerase (transcriptional regulator TenI)
MRPVPRLHLVGPLDGLTVVEYIAVAEAAVRGGVDGVHVRMPGAATDEVVRLARDLRARVGGAALIVNDRLDVALVVGADGAQLGERSFTVADARTILGTTMLVGRSVHDVDGARQAARDGADYLLAGHVFDTSSKAGLPGRGIDWLRQVVAAAGIPVIALGGITTKRVPEVLAAGAHGVAMGRELSRAERPEEASRAATRAIEAAVRSFTS